MQWPGVGISLNCIEWILISLLRIRTTGIWFRATSLYQQHEWGTASSAPFGGGGGAQPSPWVKLRRAVMGQEEYDDENPAVSSDLDLAVPQNVIVTPPTCSVDGISIASLSDALSHGMGALPPVRLGVVCMTKRPCSFERWLQYHRDALRVERFYIRVEDTPELQGLLSSSPWEECCDVSFHADTTRSWTGQTERQSTHVEYAITRARADGLTHLLHIDDDVCLKACRDSNPGCLPLLPCVTL